MGSLITAAARALATGNPLGALKRVALFNFVPPGIIRSPHNGMIAPEDEDLRRRT